MEENKKLRIIQRLLGVLAEERCTAAEADQVLQETKQVVFLTARVCADWPKGGE